MSLDSPDLPDPPSHKSGHRWLDMVVSLCALLTSAVSIYMATQNSRSMEDLVHANSWPFLQMDSGNVDEARNVPIIAFSVKNAGTGPARVHSFEFLFDGEPVERGFVWDNIARLCCAPVRTTALAAVDNPIDAYGIITTSNAAPGFISPQEELTVLAWPRTPANRMLWDTMDEARKAGRITTRACYCSVFDECWVAETSAFPPRPIASCEPGAPPR